MKGQPLSVLRRCFSDLLELRVAICKQLNAAPYLGGVHSISFGHNYEKRPCQAYVWHAVHNKNLFLLRTACHTRGCLFWHVVWRARRNNGRPAFAEHVPIYVHTYFIRCPAAEYAIQKPDGNLTRLSPPE